jgi:hypothetical protein
MLPGSSVSYACFLGIDPSIIPYLLVIGAGCLLLGVVFDPQPHLRDFLAAPPGFGFVVLGGSVLEIGTTYAFGAWGWRAWSSFPYAPTLLAAGAVLLAQGGWSWWVARAASQPSLSATRTTGSDRLVESRGMAVPPRRQAWPALVMALGVTLIAFGLFAWIIWLVSIKASCDGIPLYMCYYPGLDPFTGLWVVILGGVLLLIGAIFDAAPHRRGFASVGSSLALLVLGGGVLEAAVVLYVVGNGSLGWTIDVYAPILLVTGGLMVARGASLPTQTRSAWRLLVILGIAGLVLELGYVWYFVSNEAWSNYVGVALLAEAAYVGVAYGVLFSSAILLRMGIMNESRLGRGSDTHRQRRVDLMLIVSGAATFAIMVGWLIFVGGVWLPSITFEGITLPYVSIEGIWLPCMLVGATVHVVPFVAILIGLGSPSRATRTSTPA